MPYYWDNEETLRKQREEEMAKFQAGFKGKAVEEKPMSAKERMAAEVMKLKLAKKGK